jgi:hypothetical protein
VHLKFTLIVRFKLRGAERDAIDCDRTGRRRLLDQMECAVLMGIIESNYQIELR